MMQISSGRFIECYVETHYCGNPRDFDRLRFNKQLLVNHNVCCLTGDTGTGKSSLIRHYAAKHPEQVRHGFIHKPLLRQQDPQ